MVGHHAPVLLRQARTSITQNYIRPCILHPRQQLRYASSSTQTKRDELNAPSEDNETIPLAPPSTQAVHTSLGQTSFSDSSSSTSPSPSPSSRPISADYDSTSSSSSSSSSSTPTTPPKTPDSGPAAGFKASIPPHVQERLAEWSAAVSKHSKHVAQEAEKRFVNLGLKVNEMTGYKEVERLKALVFTKEDELQRLRESARSAKISYDEAVSSRSEAQRDVNSLLERKHSWSDSDVSRFTTLVRADHTSTHLVSSTSVALKDAEIAVDKSFSELMQVILQRYHEEQMWSDKIRSVSTYANLLGLLLNLVVFVGAVAVVEPWKRKRLVERLEERMAGMMERVEERLGGVEGKLVPPIPIPTAITSIPLESNEKMEESSNHILDSTPTSPVPISDTPPISGSTSDRNNYPILKTAIEGLPPYLDYVAQPSAERDLAIAGLLGAAASALLIGITRAVAGK